MRFRKLLRRSQTRINLLFTMSEIPHARPVKDNACEVMFRGQSEQATSSIFNSLWWSQTGSNRRPHACKARALPTELWPRSGWNFGMLDRKERSLALRVVGLGRFELPTSRLSSARSNQLSY